MRFTADGQDYTDLGTTAVPGAAEDFTVTCWARLVVDRDVRQCVWSMDRGMSVDSLSLSTATDGTTLQIVTVDMTPSVLAVNIVAMVIGQWYHVVIRRTNGGNDMEWSVVSPGGAVTAGLDQDARWSLVGDPTNFRIGESVAGGAWFNGRVNALKMWNAFLGYSTGDLHTEQEFWLPRRTTNLIRAHPLMTADDDTLDFSGNGNTLDGGVGASVEDGPPIMWAPRSIVVPAAAQAAAFQAAWARNSNVVIQ